MMNNLVLFSIIQIIIENTIMEGVDEWCGCSSTITDGSETIENNYEPFVIYSMK